MNLTESFRVAVDSIFTNRIRAMLTMLGIIIGVGAVIGLVSLGRGVEGYIANEFAGLGANLLSVTSKKPDSNTRTRIDPLLMADVAALSNAMNYPLFADVGAIYEVPGFVVDNGNNMSLTVRGVTANMGRINNWNVSLGTYITDQHIERSERVAVLGRDVVKKLYDDPDFDPIGRVIRLNQQPYTVVGVLESRSGGFGSEDKTLLIPISTAQTRLSDARINGSYQVNSISVQAVSDEAMDAAELDVKAYFFDAHNIRFEGEQDYSVVNSGDLLLAIGAITGLLTVFLALIASISLLVGGIGIMNIMLVSVTERTKEIGLRKAVGARPRDILLQFLLESLILSLIGGGIGIALGWGIAVLGSILVPSLPLSVGADAIILATSISIFIGIFFGIFPANRGARMNPIDALRFE